MRRLEGRPRGSFSRVPLAKIHQGAKVYLVSGKLTAAAHAMGLAAGGPQVRVLLELVGVDVPKAKVRGKHVKA